MRLLLVHRSYPGQYRWMLDSLARLSVDVKFICAEKTNWTKYKNVEVIVNDLVVNQIKANRQTNLIEAGAKFGSYFIGEAFKLKQSGWVPDAIWAHFAWGSWMVKDVFSKSKLILYVEWWYTTQNSSYTSLRANNPEANAITTLTNSAILNSINISDYAYVPTYWQRSQFPNKVKEKLEVVQDGFPLNIFRSNNEARKESIKNSNSINLLYSARGIEYTRGGDRIVNLVELLDKEKIDFRLTLMGDERKVYDDNDTYMDTLKQLQYLKSHPRVQRITQQPYGKYIEQFWRNDIHLYLSRPFILSWSFMESILCGSTIFSIENPATFEKMNPNHYDLKSIEEIGNIIKQMRDKKQISELATNDWLENTGEGLLFKQNHSLNRQVTRLLELSL